MTLLLAVSALGVVSAAPAGAAGPSLDPFVCRTYTTSVAGTVGDPALAEISGMARGRRDTSVLWVHNDSGAKPDVHALTLTGQTRQVFRLSGATAKDWEDMDVGPGPVAGTNYLYMGDIGDNGKKRPNITVYRVPEPAVTGPATVTALAGAQPIVAAYPDGPHNAEAMAVGIDGTIYVITKETTDPRVRHSVPAVDDRREPDGEDRGRHVGAEGRHVGCRHQAGRPGADRARLSQRLAVADHVGRVDGDHAEAHAVHDEHLSRREGRRGDRVLGQRRVVHLDRRADQRHDPPVQALTASSAADRLDGLMV